ncbi:hypothetical protein F5X68DRAFT_244821 [Plectosphaerella plurivora]|uniref:Uncharacterized protein n=1 Tax=Plectosphaerella plurivora TaxID=936078 RepID=A0A9P9A9R8_9PEZI|nr:hypothetical protein F5X68DRAFT_244821 [Plectosphaerella plurivora]
MDDTVPSPMSGQSSLTLRTSRRVSLQARPSPISIPPLSGNAVTARRLLDSPDNFASATPITPSPPPSSRATSASFFDNSDESTLSLPDADQGPHPRVIRGWTAFSDLTFVWETPRQEEEEPQAVEEIEEVVAPVTKNQRRTTELCGLCHKTRLIGGRKYCAKCTKKYNITDSNTPSVAGEENADIGVSRTPEEVQMLNLYHGELPEPYNPTDEDYADFKDEVLRVESDPEGRANLNSNEIESREVPRINKRSNIYDLLVTDGDELMAIEEEEEGVDVEEEDEPWDDEGSIAGMSLCTEEQSISIGSEASEMELEDNRPGRWTASNRLRIGQRVRGLLPEFHPYRRV